MFLQKARDQKAYTLIEMAIVFSVIGILMTVLMQGYNIYAKKKGVETTEKNVFSVVASLNAFMAQNGRYPCPAPMDVPRDHPTYGFEGEACVDSDLRTENFVSCGFNAAMTGCSLGEAEFIHGGVQALDASVGGAASVNGNRRVNINPRSAVNCTTAVDRLDNPDCGNRTAWHGVVPFRTLGIPENVSEDGYASRINYSVSQNLTKVESYRPDGGVISVVDERGNALVNPQGSAHFVVFSPGMNKMGAFSRAGNQISPCPTLSSITADAINCPFTRDKGGAAVFNQLDLAAPSVRISAATYRQSVYALPSTDQSVYFDDYVRFYTSSESPLWRLADDNGNIVDLASTEEGKSRVGVGLASTDPTAALDLAGASILGANTIKSAKICDKNGKNCFEPAQIAGTNGCQTEANGNLKIDTNTGYGVGCTTMNCPPGQYVTRIYGKDGKAKVECTEDLVITCPAGQIMLGLDGDGKLICESVSSCPPMNVKTCNINNSWQEYSLTSGLQGQSFRVPPDGYIGYSFTADYKCDSAQWRLQKTDGVCECVPVNSQIVKGCTDPALREGFWDGSTKSEFTRECKDNKVIETTTVIAAAETACTCRDGTETQTRACDAGFSSGNKVFKRDWKCATTSSGNWVIQEPRTDAQGWYEDTAASTCLCSESFETRQKNCGDFIPGWSGTFTQTRELKCGGAATSTSAGTIGAWSPVPTLANPPSSCTCNSFTETAPLQSCPPGQQGYIESSRVLCCSENYSPRCKNTGVQIGAFTPYFNSSNTCAVTSWQWTEVPSGAESQFTDNPSGFRIGTPCTKSGPDNIVTCSAFYSGSQYRLVSCRCQ